MRCNLFAENAQCLETKEDSSRRVDSQEDENRPVFCRHEDRYSIEVLVESPFQDRTASWFRIVSGIDKYVTESMQTKEEEHRASGKTTTEARSDAVFRFYSCS